MDRGQKTTGNYNGKPQRGEHSVRPAETPGKYNGARNSDIEPRSTTGNHNGG